MTDHAELNARAARLVGFTQLPDGRWKSPDGRWCRSLPNPAGNYNDFAEVLRSEVVRSALVSEPPCQDDLDNEFWLRAKTDLPAALEDLLDAVEADRREGAA